MHIIILCTHSESNKSAKCVFTVFIILVVSLILGSPTSNKGKDSSVYDSLINTCPLLTKTQFQKYSNFTRQCGPLKNLINFKVEENVKVADVNYVLCLLYFNSFNSSCSNQTELESDILLDPQIKKDVVCKKLPQILSQVTWPQNLSTIFQVEDNCHNLCIETSDLRRDICLLSFGIIQYSLRKHNNTTHSAVPHIKEKKPDNFDGSFNHSAKEKTITGEVKYSHNDAPDQNKKAYVPPHSKGRSYNAQIAQESFNSRNRHINTDNNDEDTLIKLRNNLDDALPLNEGKIKVNGNSTAKKSSNSDDTEIQKVDMNNDYDNLVNPNQQSKQNILPAKQGSVDEISEDGLEDPKNVNADDNEKSRPYITEDNILPKDALTQAELEEVAVNIDLIPDLPDFDPNNSKFETSDEEENDGFNLDSQDLLDEFESNRSQISTQDDFDSSDDDVPLASLIDLDKWQNATQFCRNEFEYQCSSPQEDPTHPIKQPLEYSF